jgi:hypothetical protein
MHKSPEMMVTANWKIPIQKSVSFFHVEVAHAEALWWLTPSVLQRQKLRSLRQYQTHLDNHKPHILCTYLHLNSFVFYITKYPRNPKIKSGGKYMCPSSDIHRLLFLTHCVYIWHYCQNKQQLSYKLIGSDSGEGVSLPCGSDWIFRFNSA